MDRLNAYRSHIIFASLLLIAGVIIPAAYVSALLPTPPKSAFNASTCETIDKNWKAYPENLSKTMGANKEVTDVVSNACAGIGEEVGKGCRITSGHRPGRSQSQHFFKRAIDLRVPLGKEREFITLAICGLRKVNGCKGGIGMYKSKALHVDVRPNATNAWGQNRSRSSITPQFISDPHTRSILKAFDADKCTGGVVGDYSETEQYGPAEQYTPPQDLPQHLWPQGPGTVAGDNGGGSNIPQLQEALSPSPGFTSGSGGTPVQGTELAFQDQVPLIEEPDNNKDDDGTKDVSLDQATFNDEPFDPETEKEACENTGFFGTNLFSSCSSETDEDTEREFAQATDDFNDAEDTIGFERHRVSDLGDDAFTTQEGFGPVGRFVSIFQGIGTEYHIPGSGALNDYYAYDGAVRTGGMVRTSQTQFIPGETEEFIPEDTQTTESVVPQAVRAVTGASSRVVAANLPHILPGGLSAPLLVSFITNRGFSI